MGALFSHVLAAAFGAAIAGGIVRAVTLPRRQADGIAKVVDRIAPGVTGAQVQSANAALAEEIVGQAAQKAEQP